MLPESTRGSAEWRNHEGTQETQREQDRRRRSQCEPDGGAFSLYSRKRYGRSAAASLAEYGIRPVKTLAARIPMTERIARLADHPEPARTVTFPAWGRFFYDLERSEDSGMPVYHVRQRTPSSAVIVYLHGGGYISTAVSAHAWLVDHLARRTGADVVMPLYPLTPHHTWSEAHRLVLDLYRRTVAENPGKRIVLMGDSAGGAWRRSSPCPWPRPVTPSPMSSHSSRPGSTSPTPTRISPTT